MAGSCTAGPTSICSGPASGGDTGQIINSANPVTITTVDGFGLDVIGGASGFEISGRGGVTFTDKHASVITTDGWSSLYAVNAVSGDLSIESTGSLLTTGAGSGINIENSGMDTVVRVQDTEGGENGIQVDHNGSGSVHIISNGRAIGHRMAGIYGYVWSGTGMTVDAADTQGATEGIFARNGARGPLVVTSTGLAKGGTLRGILADNLNTGSHVSVTARDTEGGQIGIRVNQHGSGGLWVNSTGTASGGLTGLSTQSYASSKHTTINAVHTVGGGSGIYAIHRGSGPVTVTSTGLARGITLDGIIVETGAGSSGLNVTARDVQGGNNGIKTVHGSAAGIAGNAATITVAGHILGGTGYGIATESVAGVLTTINVAAGSVVESVAGNGIANGDGDSNIVIAEGGTVNGQVSLGLGSDTISLRGSLSGITVLDGGGGGADVLNLSDAVNVIHAGGDIRNWSAINLDNTTLTLTGGGVAVGIPGDMRTGIFLRNGSTLNGSQDNFSLAGNMSLAAGTRFLASGNGMGSNVITGNVVNAGLISMAGGGAGDRVRIDGHYIGNNGAVVLETSLGGDTSATDRLIIGGNTSGESKVRVINANGLGAATNEGIEIITVACVSDGAFTLVGDYQINNGPVVVAGAYAYRLTKGNRTGTEMNNWYLRSERLGSDNPPNDPLYQAGAPAYEAYPQALLGLNTVPTLQQRVGNRFWLNNSNPAGANDNAAFGLQSGAGVLDTGIWARIDGVHSSIDPHFSTTGVKFDQNIFKAQAGIDGPRLESESGTLLGAVTAHYSHGVTNTRSTHGDGRIATNGYGLGGTLTWYGLDGIYIDGQARATWYQSDLLSLIGNRSLVKGNDAFGYALSMEGGQRVAIRKDWLLTPQAQLVYSHVDFDKFVDAFGAPVSLDKGASLVGRLGLSLARETSWQDANGQTSRAYGYGIANIYHEFAKGTRVDVAGVSFDFEKGRVWGGLGAGGSYSWNDGAYSLYAEGLVNTSLARLGDSYSLQGKIGGRMRW